MSEFGVRLKSIVMDKALLDKIESLLGEAGDEFLLFVLSLKR